MRKMRLMKTGSKFLLNKICQPRPVSKQDFMNACTCIKVLAGTPLSGRISFSITGILKNGLICFMTSH